MRKGLLKRMTSLLSVLTLLCVMMLPGLSAVAAPADQVTFSTGSASENARRGDTVTIPVVMTAANGDSVRMAGISFSVSYDKTRLSYVESTVQSDYASLRSAYTYHNTGQAKVSLSWTGDSPVQLPASAKLFTFSFKVLDGAAQGTTPLTVTISELYDSSVSGGTVTWRDIAVTNPTFKKDIVVTAQDSQVTEVINAIDAIGVVTYTAASLNKINAAAAKYALLSQAQKAAVTNYDKLLAAQIEYERLKALASQTPVNNEISAFLQKHSGALALTVDTVTLANEAAVNAAWSDFEKLSAAAKNEIFYYNPRLKALLARLAVLKKEEQDRQKAEEAERLLREEAAEMAKTFRTDKAAVLGLKDDAVTVDHYLVLNDALTLLNMFSGMNPYVADLLEQERVLLTRLFKIAEEKYIEAGKEPEPGTLEATKFRSAFAWILSQTDKSVTADDKMDIVLALEVYKLQSDAAQKLLASEYDLLNKLLARAEKLEKEKDSGKQDPDDKAPGTASGSTGGSSSNPDDGDPAGGSSQEPKVIVINKDGGNVDLNLANRDMGVVVYILLLLLVPALLIFGSLQLYYHKYLKPRYAKAER